MSNGVEDELSAADPAHTYPFTPSRMDEVLAGLKAVEDGDMDVFFLESQEQGKGILVYPDQVGDQRADLFAKFSGKSPEYDTVFEGYGLRAEK